MQSRHLQNIVYCRFSVAVFLEFYKHKRCASRIRADAGVELRFAPLTRDYGG